jgi:hypothetical protein
MPVGQSRQATPDWLGFFFAKENEQNSSLYQAVHTSTRAGKLVIFSLRIGITYPYPPPVSNAPVLPSAQITPLGNRNNLNLHHNSQILDLGGQCIAVNTQKSGGFAPPAFHGVQNIFNMPHLRIGNYIF